jgi:opacity protein-like surface antigen
VKWLATAVVALLFSAAALAQESGWYAGGARGQSSMNVGGGELSRIPTNAGYTVSGVLAENERNLAWKALIGYRISRHFALEVADMSKLGALDAHTTYTARFGFPFFETPLYMRIEAKDTLSIAGIGILPLRPVSLFGKVGMYRSEVELTFIDNNYGRQTRSSSDTGLLYGFGASYDLSEKITLRAEWERFNKVGDKDVTGESSVTLMSVGAVYRFY